ncbi:MAG: hypothetical protein ACPGOY_18190 [Rhodospirillaceae bacterium]
MIALASVILSAPAWAVEPAATQQNTLEDMGRDPEREPAQPRLIGGKPGPEAKPDPKPADSAKRTGAKDPFALSNPDQDDPAAEQPAKAAFSLRVIGEPIPFHDPEPLQAHRDAVLEAGNKAVHCGPVAGLEGVTLCLFESSGLLNHLLGRVMWYADQGLRTRLLNAALFADPYSPDPSKAVTGVNLHAREIVAFRDAVKETCAAEVIQVCLTDAEQAFLDDFLLPWVETAPQGYLIASAAGAGRTGTLSHELLHGYFNSLPDYRDAVFSFWLETYDTQARKAVQTELGRIFATAAQTRIIDEFQAFLLQCHDSPILAFQRRRDRDKLAEAMAPHTGGLPIPPLSCP